MTDRRKSPPLFDLMRERERAAHAPDPIAPSNDPTAQAPRAPQTPANVPDQDTPERTQPPQSSGRSVAWDSSGGVSRAERSAAAMLDEAPNTDKSVKLAMSMVYLVIAIMLAALVAAWVGGHQLGYNKGKAEMQQLMKVDPVVRPPAQTDPASADPIVNDQPTDTTPITNNRPQMNGIDPNAPGMAIMTANGYMETDPRQHATNYLELATLPRDEAVSAINFLNTQGVPVIGIPRLDSRHSDANNPSRYTLYSLGVAAPGDQFRTMTRERDDHQSLIARLGNQWQREFRGGSDFAVSKTQWVKYTP